MTTPLEKKRTFSETELPGEKPLLKKPRTTALLHGIIIDTSSSSSLALGMQVPDKIFHLIIQSLETHLETHRRKVQYELNGRGWRNLFGEHDSYSASCKALDKECALTRLSWKLVCKKWFLFTHNNYSQIQRLTKAVLQLQEKIITRMQFIKNQ